MRQNLPWLVALMVPLGLACGSSTTATGGSGAGTTAASGTGAGTTATGSGGSTMGGAIPDPGTSDMVDNDFTDVEPNNTPQQATPLGVAAMGDVNVWVNMNTIGGSSNSADFFVFKSAATAGMFTFDICFNAPTTAMTATLWKVENATQQMPPVGTWTSSGTCVTDQGSVAALEASTEYLFGLTATGGVGSYAA